MLRKVRRHPLHSNKNIWVNNHQLDNVAYMIFNWSLWLKVMHPPAINVGEFTINTAFTSSHKDQKIYLAWFFEAVWCSKLMFNCCWKNSTVTITLYTSKKTDLWPIYQNYNRPYFILLSRVVNTKWNLIVLYRRSVLW